MAMNRMNKWIAAGAVAVATIPAVGFARSHRPVQAAPPSLMATGSEVSSTPAELPAVKPSAVTVSHSKKLHSGKVRHGKLHSRKSAHRNLRSGSHKASKLSHKHRKHSNLHASTKHVAQ